MKKWYTITLILVFLIIAGSLVDAQSENPTQQNHISPWTEYAYSVFYIESMPCVHVNILPGSLSCDWSQWDGER